MQESEGVVEVDIFQLEQYRDALCSEFSCFRCEKALLKEDEVWSAGLRLCAALRCFREGKSLQSLSFIFVVRFGDVSTGMETWGRKKCSVIIDFLELISFCSDRIWFTRQTFSKYADKRSNIVFVLAVGRLFEYDLASV